MKNLRNSKIFWIACMIMIWTLSGVLGSACAYLLDADAALNKMIVGDCRIHVEEEYDPPTELGPGSFFTKKVAIQNEDSCDAYIRVKVVFTDYDIGKYCTLDWNTENFIHNQGDDYWYYTKALNKEEKTPNLFQKVTLSNDILPEEIKDFDILVYAEAIQADGYTDYKYAWAKAQKNK